MVKKSWMGGRSHKTPFLTFMYDPHDLLNCFSVSLFFFFWNCIFFFLKLYFAYSVSSTSVWLCGWFAWLLILSRKFVLWKSLILNCVKSQFVLKSSFIPSFDKKKTNCHNLSLAKIAIRFFNSIHSLANLNFFFT